MTNQSSTAPANAAAPFEPLTLDPDNLDAELVRIVPEFSRATFELASANLVVASAKAARDSLEAKYTVDFRTTAEIQGGRTSQALIEAKVAGLADVQRVRHEYIRAVAARDGIKAHVESLRMKQQALELLMRSRVAEMRIYGYQQTTA